MNDQAETKKQAIQAAENRVLWIPARNELLVHSSDNVFIAAAVEKALAMLDELY
ncbi:MAG: hypothetical protein JRC87_02505 [Deltaproteobacteria bacterium]|nr:hypothetical protein [Deltaproteobacteria bacterium]MBW2658458.1 hypothetical protein [Deltaproteobacteria bacterium]